MPARNYIYGILDAYVLTKIQLQPIVAASQLNIILSGYFPRLG